MGGYTFNLISIQGGFENKVLFKFLSLERRKNVLLSLKELVPLYQECQGVQEFRKNIVKVLKALGMIYRVAYKIFMHLLPAVVCFLLLLRGLFITILNCFPKSHLIGVMSADLDTNLMEQIP